MERGHFENNLIPPNLHFRSSLSVCYHQRALGVKPPAWSCVLEQCVTEIHVNGRCELLSSPCHPLWSAHRGADTTSRLCALASGLLFPRIGCRMLAGPGGGARRDREDQGRAGGCSRDTRMTDFMAVPHAPSEKARLSTPTSYVPVEKEVCLSDDSLKVTG